MNSFRGFIGVATRDITPPVGIYARNWGAAKHEVATGVHRPLTLRVLTLQNEKNGKPLVLVVLDLSWWKTREDEWFLRGALLEELKVDESRVLMSLTHTHASSSTCREDENQPGGELISPYLDRVKSRLIEAAREALNNAQVAILDWVYGVSDMARNRDLPDPDAPENSPRIVCGWNPENPSDNTLLVGRACDESGKPFAILANYACHPTTLAWENELISPDWVGAFNETIETATGATAFFLQGASGELQPRECFVKETEIADAHGRNLAFATLAALQGMQPAGTQLKYQGVVESGAPLAIWRRENIEPSNKLEAERVFVSLELQNLPSAQELEDELAATADRTLAERLRRKARVRRSVGDGTSYELPIYLWRIGDMTLVAQGEEAYSQFQTELRQRFPNQTLGVMNLVNGGSGYLPPRALYQLNLYQVWQSPYAEGGLERLIDRVAEALSGTSVRCAFTPGPSPNDGRGEQAL